MDIVIHHRLCTAVQERVSVKAGQGPYSGLWIQRTSRINGVRDGGCEFRIDAVAFLAFLFQCQRTMRLAGASAVNVVADGFHVRTMSDCETATAQALWAFLNGYGSVTDVILSLPTAD